MNYKIMRKTLFLISANSVCENVARCSTLTIIILLAGFLWAMPALGNAAPSPTSTPTPTPTPITDEAKKAEAIRLEEEIQILKLRKEKEELQKAIRAAQPAPTSTPLSGDVTGAGNMFMEVEMQTYKAMKTSTDRIACGIYTLKPGAKVIVLYTPNDYALWRNYKLTNTVLNTQLNDIENRYGDWLGRVDRAQPAGAIGVITGATTALRAAADLAAFLRSNVDIASKSVTIDEKALRSTMINSLRLNYQKNTYEGCQENDNNKSAAVILYDPSIFTAAGGTDGFSSEILKKVQDIYLLKTRADDEIRLFDILAAEIDDTKARLKTAKEALAKIKTIIRDHPTAIAKLDKQIAEATNAAQKKELQEARDALQREFDQAMQDKPDSESDVTAIQTALAVKEGQLTAALKNKIAHLKLLNTDFTQFLVAFTTLNDDTGMSPLLEYVVAENLDKVLQNGGQYNETYWLEISPVKAGGNNRVRKNLFRYFYEPDISHSGGAILEFKLTDKTGSVILSNTDKSYQKYQKASNIQK